MSTMCIDWCKSRNTPISNSKDMKKIKRVRRTVSFTERTEEMMEQLMEVRAYPNISALLSQGVNELYTSCFPAYARAPKVAMTPEEKVHAKMAQKKAKEDIIDAEQAKICDTLGGTVVTNENERKECHYSTYSFDDVFEQIVPLSFMTNTMIQGQYHPSKERCEELIAKKNAKKK